MPTHDEYVKVIKATIVEAVTKSTMTALVAILPWLSWSIVYKLAYLIVGKIISIAVYETEMAIFLQYTDLRVGRQGKDFVNAALKNAEMQKSGTPEQKAQAQAELIDRLREFVKLKN